MKLDERGKQCPRPVIDTKKALESCNPGETVEVLVDNEIAVQNLSKMAGEEPVACQPDSRKKGMTVVLSSNLMGHGDPELGKALMKGFVYALTQQDALPETILLYNSGAYLSCEGSDNLEDLKSLESQGVEILTCGTCLNFYGLSEKLQVGSVTNMYEIVERMTASKLLVRP